MAFPTTQVTTDNLDAASDDPSLARVDLLDAVTKLNTIIDEGGSANGVALLNGSGKLSASQIPATISATGIQVLSPTGGVVQIQDILRLTPKTTAELNALTSVAGDVAFCSSGVDSAGEPCMALYDGSAWRAITLGETLS